MNDREILARLEAASPQELDGLLRRPSADAARVYRAYFGPERYEALRRRTLQRRPATRGTRAPKRGNVVILHGIMGGELTLREAGSGKGIWMNILRLAFGAVEKLRMKDGQSVFDIHATGILKKWYAEQILELGYDWNVQTYWYDWRCDLNEIADGLLARINDWFGGEAPVNLVAHSMGGLVSRTYIARHPERWNKAGREKQRAKLIMLGTPNHGSFAIPQVITGALDTVRKLALVDVKHSLEEITGILGGLPGSLEMLPSPLVMPAMARLYQGSTWGGRVTQALLDRARRHHERLAGIVDGERMFYIAGCNRRTHDDIRDWKRLDSLEGYSASMNGDGTVPHRLGFLEQDGVRIPTWFVQEDHGALPNNPRVISATQLLLLHDTCELARAPEGGRSIAADRSVARDGAAGERTRRDDEEARLRTLVEHLRPGTRGAEAAEAPSVSREEIEAEEIVLRSFLSASGSTAAAKADVTHAPRGPSQTPPPEIEIAVQLADIADLPATRQGVPPVDALAVGHYIGVAPQFAELALDRSISGWKPGDPEDKLVITALHRRGTIAAQLGQQFIVPDPRHPGRLTVLAGMGKPGTFGVAELTVATRELAWTLGRMGCRHLASVLIGAGVGNIGSGLAVQAWLRGLRRALYDAQATGAPRLERLTFVEYHPASFVRLHQAVKKLVPVLAGDAEPLSIIYRSPSPAELDKAKADAEESAVAWAKKSIQRDLAEDEGHRGRDPEPTRFTVGLREGTYEFSVLSSEASIPQRNTTVDPALIEEINRHLVAAPSHERQRDLGNLLGRMLVPEDLRTTIIKPGVPTVLAVDATTARIHFELAALSPAAGSAVFDPEAFLGPAASLTRQLRTTFAPLPETSITTGRALRVLVIADPCEEAPLPGAQAEGEAVAELFERFGEGGRPVEVVRLLGPGEATRVAVLDCLVNRRFDMVHYAGHCFFNKENPPHSGWLFSRHEVLSANELSRIDRVPRFVFSNACESGITPDRADQRHAALAPSFAEAFFGRGVGNLICTAWPVGDEAALGFAQRVYRGLLGLGMGAEPLHEAIKAARVKIATETDGGLSTWGAYQHYGDPYFRISLPTPLPAAAPAESGTPRTGPRRRAKSKGAA